MKNELYRSVSWLGSNGRTYLTHSSTRFLLLGIAAMFAAFLSFQALAPAPTFAQDGDGFTAEKPLDVESGGECAADPAINDGEVFYETTVFDSLTPTEVIATISGCTKDPDAADTFNSAASAMAEILTGEDDDHALFELKPVSPEQETALDTKVATNLHLKAGSELTADVEYNVSVKLSQDQVDGTAFDSQNQTYPTKTVEVTVHLKINVEVSLMANPNWNPGFTQVPQDGSRSARLADAFITGGGIELTYTVVSSRTVVARVRIIGTTARVDGISGGQADITVTATARNETAATQTFTVRVREGYVPPQDTATPAPTPTPAPDATAIPPTATPTNTPVPATATATATPRPTNTPVPSATPTVVPTIAPPAPPTDTPTIDDEGGIGAGALIVGLIILVLLGLGAFLLLRRRGGGGPAGGPDDGMDPDDMLDDGGGMDDDGEDTDMEDADDMEEEPAEDDGDGDEDMDGDEEDGDADGDEEEEEEERQ